MSTLAPIEVERVASVAAGRVPALEWPTLAVLIADYAAWLALTKMYGHWPLWLIVPGVVLLLTLHSSLQHEVLHGHPTRSAAVNRLFGIVPLSLWLPYVRYRRLHLKHHINDRLTDPFDDPESCYWTPEVYRALSWPARCVVKVNQTLAGRVIVGPWWHIARFLQTESVALARNEPGVRAAWIEHLLWCVPVVLWVTVICGMPLWLYIVAMVIPGSGILLIRAYAEHRAQPGFHERTAIVEGSWLLGPLFLFNNLHSLHHDEPLLPWYRYNARYRQVRARLVAENGGLVYRTYIEVARRFLLWPHDHVEHPTGRVPTRG